MSATCVYYLQSIQFVIEGLTFMSPSSNTVTFLLLCTTQGFSTEEYVRCLVTSIPINNSCETILCIHITYAVESTFPAFSATPCSNWLETLRVSLTKHPQSQFFFRSFLSDKII